MHYYFPYTLNEASGSTAIFERVFSTDLDDSELERIEYLRELVGQVRDPPVGEEAEDPHAFELRLLEPQQPPRATGGGGSVRRLDGVDRARAKEEGEARRASWDAEREPRGVVPRPGDRGAERRADAAEPEDVHASVETIADHGENLRREIGPWTFPGSLHESLHW